MTKLVNNEDLMEVNRLSANSNGGTEIMMRRIYDGRVPRELLEQVQIIPSRVRDLQLDKWRIFFCHDLIDDPELQKAVANDNHRNYHVIVCVSNWQAQQLINFLGVPWSKIVVLPNAITPIQQNPNRDNSQIRLIYHTTPHRGLQILLPVFSKLSEKFPNLHLDVYSSFQIYGWNNRDEQYKEVFAYADKQPNVTNHGYKPHDEIVEALSNAHIFGYPSIWKETSCLCLMEAMSAGLLCVHPNFGGLYETAAHWTHMYNYTEDMHSHADLFYAILHDAISQIFQESVQQRCKAQSVYTNSFYNWDIRARQWEALIRNLIGSGVAKEVPPPQFVYSY